LIVSVFEFFEILPVVFLRSLAMTSKSVDGSMLNYVIVLSRSMPLTATGVCGPGADLVSRKRNGLPSWLARKIICFPSVSLAL